MIVYNFSSRSVIIFWYISRENHKNMTGLLFHDGAGPVVYMWLPGKRRALRVRPAKIWLMVYCRCVISDLNVTFRIYFWYFFGVASLFRVQ